MNLKAWKSRQSPLPNLKYMILSMYLTIFFFKEIDNSKSKTVKEIVSLHSCESPISVYYYISNLPLPQPDLFEKPDLFVQPRSAMSG